MTMMTMIDDDDDDDDMVCAFLCFLLRVNCFYIFVFPITTTLKPHTV